MDKSFFAGSVGGLLAVLIGHPFDTIKVRLQSNTFKTQGFRGIYNGITSPILGVVPIFALSFSTFENAKQYFGKENILLAACLHSSILYTNR